jgi:hypothetical protein
MGEGGEVVVSVLKERQSIYHKLHTLVPGDFVRVYAAFHDLC